MIPRWFEVAQGPSAAAAAAGHGELPEHIRRFVLFRLPEQGRYAANITHYYEINATVSESVTKAAIELRAQMMQVFRVMRRDLPGFANAYISASGSYPGIRESRRIAGVTYFTVDMLRECPVPEKYLADKYRQGKNYQDYRSGKEPGFGQGNRRSTGCAGI